ncbi:hypothetical protein IG193_04740 [Infirmifilum lucidum]|uniref:Uncharacterized protein n=1 Tax=Infirmifilum lucidum TaxID=2776706 RepID=A0A7L9FED6_9CREN|nr:hypothetical protein [Infirmifilum lucidum]QOJ78099.1 hypothetical protein IG193_04740 [Infirmifilum lucidum]
MTKWTLRCESCGGEKVLDVGFNLYEFKRVYIYCPKCRANTFHIVVGHEEQSE